MTIQEYNQKKAAIDAERDKAMKVLNAQYATENNPYKVGDIIKDHLGYGRIKGWLVTKNLSSGMPELIYRCDNITAKGEIKKREPVRDIYCRNIKK